jgi:pimeloyl-ACP methyl ester carboxylesterase
LITNIYQVVPEVLVSKWYVPISLPRKKVGADHGQVRFGGMDYQTQIDAGPKADNKTAKFFDVISFDPRGIGNTSPKFRCLPNFIEQWNYMREQSAYGLPGSSFTTFTNLWTNTRTLADSCSKRAIEAGIGEHMSTTSVARDIVEIFERHGEWREQEARRLLSSFTQSQTELSDRVKHQPGQEMVQYWGISYGTVIGATLADMYPDRVQRMILDGVVDSFDYYQGTRTTDLQDTDMELDKFAEYCWRGGPENCALYHEDGPNSIAQRFTNITQNLMHDPIGVPGTDNFTSGLATYGDLKAIFMAVSYHPLTMFHLLAELMADLENGNATALVQGRRRMSSKILAGLPQKCLTDGPYSDACFPSHIDMGDTMIMSAIECSDAEPQTNMTKEQYWIYVQDTIKQSKMAGDVWANARLPCTQVNSSPHILRSSEPHILTKSV